jgi:hypothetical protein
MRTAVATPTPMTANARMRIPWAQFYKVGPAVGVISGLHSLTGQCALILGEALEFVVDVKEPLRESAKFTLDLSLQLRLE